VFEVRRASSYDVAASHVPLKLAGTASRLLAVAEEAGDEGEAAASGGHTCLHAATPADEHALPTLEEAAEEPQPLPAWSRSADRGDGWTRRETLTANTSSAPEEEATAETTAVTTPPKKDAAVMMADTKTTVDATPTAVTATEPPVANTCRTAGKDAAATTTAVTAPPEMDAAVTMADTKAAVDATPTAVTATEPLTACTNSTPGEEAATATPAVATPPKEDATATMADTRPELFDIGDGDSAVSSQAFSWTPLDAAKSDA
jgi:hypothetical protein